jgi:hypothetical protein
MQPDYNQLWHSLSKYSQVNDTHFYAFYEDSLNQFISTNSNSNQTVTNKNAEQLIDNSNGNE